MGEGVEWEGTVVEPSYGCNLGGVPGENLVTGEEPKTSKETDIAPGADREA